MRPIERIPAVFEGKRSDKVVWQPRIDHWYDINKKLGTLPAECRGKELLEIYDDLHGAVLLLNRFRETRGSER